MEQLKDHTCFRTMLLLAISFGLRISEVLGLKWKDVDWKTVHIQRAVVKQVVGDVKLTNPARKMACAEELLEVLKLWHQTTEFSDAEDWMFASGYKLGRQPLGYTFVWMNLGKAANDAGIGHISSHSFRHYAESETMPNRNSETLGNSANPLDTPSSYSAPCGIIWCTFTGLQETQLLPSRRLTSPFSLG